ncbi:MAG: anti-sigma-E factor ChrR [Rhizobiaceae bacterium MnEN-MB40S]|nr:MAG: anti-sigma-E factor ChrR [Rhizobiaceae bacterium MnEN-MB40S]
MTVHHHLDDASIMRYASGDFDEAFAVVVASHLAMCPEGREAVRAAESLGGAVLEASEGTPLSAGAFDRLSRMLDVEPEAPPPPEPVSGDVPLPLSRLIGDNLHDVPWRTIVPGMQRHRIDIASTTSSLYMLKVAPGKKMPEHGHGGAEMTLILEGSYSDVFGRFAAGDIADLDEHVEHEPIVDSDVDCICLIASEHPTRFKGLISRILQPFIGI